jgi:hypothetical protein
LIDNPGAAFLAVGDARGGGVLGDAVGHAVEGQFVVDVGTEGHGSPLSTTKGIYSFLTTKTRRHEERKLCVLVPWWFVFSPRRHEGTKKKKTLCLCDLVVFHAAGHAVEGQFVVDVGTEGH